MKIAVIGGGPAGMMAAIAASQNGADVLLLEKNEKLGKKLYITGKGRCNVTNDCSVRDFFANVPTNAKFLYGAINKFSPQDTIDFLQNNGLSLKTERGNRVFPCSDKSSDVIKVLDRQLRSNGVQIRLNCPVEGIEYRNNGYLLHTITGIVSADRVIVATGGVSYSATGSTGDGYKFAKSIGHSVVEPKPALCRLLVKGAAPLEGLALKNVSVMLVDSASKVLDSQFGEMLFAADAVTGPAVLTLSSRANKLVGAKTLRVDLKPALDREKLDARILRDFSQNMNKDFGNALAQLLPERLIKIVAEQSAIPLYTKVHQVTAAQRQNLINALKGLCFPYVGLDKIEFGIVTSGGVDVSQINPSTMQSKLIDGLFFAGEVLDVDAYTGGFNIQIALSTGYVAGCNAAKW